MNKFLFEFLMLFHPFVRVKIPERFIFVSALALEIFPYYTFICKFKIQFLKAHSQVWDNFWQLKAL